MDEFQQLRSGEKPLSSRQINILVWADPSNLSTTKIIPIRELSDGDLRQYRRVSGSHPQPMFIPEEKDSIPLEISLGVLCALTNPEYNVMAT